VRASEPLDGLRVVSTPAALDAATWTGDVRVLRIAADEVLAIGAVGAIVDDPHAIVELETAFVGWRLTHDEFAAHVARLVEWPLPTARPALGQGLVAGLPLKLWFENDHVLVIASRGLVHEVVDRLGVPA
jgi:hypothetical protein